MKYSIPIKFIAILLTVVALLLGVSSVIGIVQLVNYNLYTDTIDDWLHQRLDTQTYQLASDLVERYVVTNLSNCSVEDLQALGYRHLFEDVFSWSGFAEKSFSYTISTNADGVLDSAMHGPGEGLFFEVVCSGEYPVLVTDPELIDQTYGKDYISSEQVELDNYDQPVTIRYYASPKYTVVVTLLQDAAMNRFSTQVPLVKLLYSLRYVLILVLALAVLLFPMGLVYLCIVAGKTSRDAAVHSGALNYIPLDIYAVGSALLSWILVDSAVDLIYGWTQSGKDFNAGTIALVALPFLCIAVLCIGLIYAIATQVKLPDHYWWRHTFLYWLGLRLKELFSALAALLPVVWKFLLLGIAMVLAIAVGGIIGMRRTWVPLMMILPSCGIVVCYWGACFGALLRGAKRLSQGNLNAQINTRYMIGSYKQCAQYLNNLADVAIVAARNQMKADRMKTELITNVSHDIKTPLTSIISYVDLLQSATSQEQREQYLEVLGRQSQRLKKLIEDLMELSKASTGNMHVDILPLNATETVNQALGEFSDKLQAADLNMVFPIPREEILMRADGRLSWRVLSNLLSNAVKYAMPGTRIYLELSQNTDWVEISMKNISREPLNVSAQELTERFVRGDASRNTEGSGLGLNIAKSLMELQHGQMELQVDGDLFKVTLRFPSVQ